MVLLGTEEDWRSRRAIFRCECGQKLDLDGRVDEEVLACPPHNRLVEKAGWVTRIRADGRVEWIPPPQLDSGQARVNDYHHPENYLLCDG